MPDTQDLGQLDSTAWDRLQDVTSRFEQAWTQDHTVELSTFLPPEGTPDRRLTLLELVKTELELRWKHGHVLGLEFYLEKYPELAADGVLPAALIYEEYRVRHLYGDKPRLETYGARFPAQYAEVRRLVEAQPVATQLGDAASPTPTPSASPPPSLAPQGDLNQLNLGGSFRPLKRLGTGGFGEVWRAEAPGGIEVALKIVFRPLEHAEAQRELHSLELIKKLRHPFLLQTQSFHQVQDRLYIVMELADGSLRDRLKECHRDGHSGIPAKELVQYFLEAGEALDYLHENHVQHRDVKPENILLIGRHAKVADFGLAKLQEGSQMNTATGSGTPLYMAPEIWRGRVSQHSDQYSLALTYAELRLARRVFASTDMMQVMVDHLEKTPEFPDLPAAEAQVLLQALAKDPEQRFPSCLAFAQALQAAVTGEPLRQTGTDLPGVASTGIPSGTGLGGAKTVVPPSGLGDGPVTIPTPAGLPGPSALADTEPMTAGWRQKPPTADRRRLLAVTGAVVLAGVLAGSVVLWKVINPKPSGNGDGGVVLPTGFEPDEGATVVTDEATGRKFYNRIVLTKGQEKVVFILIPQTRDSPERAFYMMRTKVWRDLFRVAANDEAFLTLLQPFEKQADWLVQRRWNLEGNGRLPVTNVTVTEAYCFARWLAPGGNLPTPAQWDRAAGRFEANRGEGPFQGKWMAGDKGIAIKVPEPAPVESSERDVNGIGIHDMAGNGFEWTRTTARASEDVPLQNPRKDDGVYLRAKDFKLSKPFLFEDVEGGKLYDQEDYSIASNTVGFRVIVLP
jgi:serine/threonine protein kinase